MNTQNKASWEELKLHRETILWKSDEKIKGLSTRFMYDADFVEEFIKKNFVHKDELKALELKYTKPTHGECCTCQYCGYDYDDCECDNNGRKIVKFLKSLE